MEAASTSAIPPCPARQATQTRLTAARSASHLCLRSTSPPSTAGTLASNSLEPTSASRMAQETTVSASAYISHKQDDAQACVTPLIIPPFFVNHLSSVLSL